ncbi:cytochrome P450 2F2-like [Gastrophryne carolinensis]
MRMELLSLSVALLALCIALLLFKYSRMISEKAKLPPGPTPLPIIGTLHKTGINHLGISLMEMYHTYGDIFTVYQGETPNVVLCGYNAIKETLIDKSEEFSGRGSYPIFSHFSKGDGMAFSNGEKWKELRSFAVATLRSFGVGNRNIEERIKEEAQSLVDIWKATKGSPVDPYESISQSVSNVICSVVFGTRFKSNDENFRKLVSCIQENFRIMSNTWGSLFNIFPNFMKYVPGPHKQLKVNFSTLTDFIRKRMEDNIRTLDTENPRDFIDCFLLRIQKEGKNSKTFFNEKTLVMTSMMLFFGGTESVGSTLRYAFLLLMKYPDVADKIYQEIDNVIGHRLPKYEDRNQMPYTKAFIHEVQRFADLIPYSIPRQVVKDTKVREYTIPKGTDIIPFLTSVHCDESQFKDPTNFNINNFLDENGKFKKNDALMPFAIGKRICPGEILAMTELFLFLTIILQNFTVKSLIPPEEISVAPVSVGMGKVTPVYTFSLVSRSDDK